MCEGTESLESRGDICLGLRIELNIDECLSLREIEEIFSVVESGGCAGDLGCGVGGTELGLLELLRWLLTDEVVGLLLVLSLSFLNLLKNPNAFLVKLETGL